MNLHSPLSCVLDWLHHTPTVRFCATLVSEVGYLCMVKTRSQAKMAENADLLALLAEMKKSMEKGQEEMRKGQAEMKDRMEKGQEEMKDRMEKRTKEIMKINGKDREIEKRTENRR
ncbi:hypothetical protein AVEN_233126-1 [Araneus ventricosus]|uniref:Uncharacterized protein n=1 Tax=Araneus ventricosus TaxID=182803 RepID=A0A4Y2N5B4_ARAVE|nr:hypothetical protein AVEN_233126-1 [Araneus ventricosus]